MATEILVLTKRQRDTAAALLLGDVAVGQRRGRRWQNGSRQRGPTRGCRRGGCPWQRKGSSRLDRAAADEGLRDGMEVEDDELEAALEHGGAAAR